MALPININDLLNKNKVDGENFEQKRIQYDQTTD